jgi:DNA-binding transcriptional LysR family regulator
LDIGIIEGQFHEKTLNSEVVSEDQMVIVAPPNHRLLGKNVRLSDLEEETWILRETGSGTREASENLFRMYNFNPKKVMEFGSTQLIKESVEAGLGISLVSRWAIGKELKNEYLGVLNVEELPFKRNFAIITHSTYQTKSLKTFIETLRQYMADHEQ